MTAQIPYFYCARTARLRGLANMYKVANLYES